MTNFYKVKATADLDHFVRYGRSPVVKTIVYRHTPGVPRRRSDWKRSFDNRGLFLRCYEAFRWIVFSQRGKDIFTLDARR